MDGLHFQTAHKKKSSLIMAGRPPSDFRQIVSQFTGFDYFRMVGAAGLSAFVIGRAGAWGKGHQHRVRESVCE